MKNKNPKWNSIWNLKIPGMGLTVNWTQQKKENWNTAKTIIKLKHREEQQRVETCGTISVNIPVIWGPEGEENGAKEKFETVMPENVPKLL